MNSLLFLAALPLLPAHAAPRLQRVPMEADTKAFAKAEAAYLASDLAVVARLYAGPKNEEDAELSLPGYAFLEAFSGLLLREAPAAGRPAKDDETPAKFELYRIAREQILKKEKDPQQARDIVASLGKFRNRLAVAQTPLALVQEYKAALAEEPSGSEGEPELYTLPVPPELAAKIASYAAPEGSSKEAVARFLRQQEDAAKKESAALLAKKQPQKKTE